MEQASNAAAASWSRNWAIRTEGRCRGLSKRLKDKVVEEGLTFLPNVYRGRLSASDGASSSSSEVTLDASDDDVKESDDDTEESSLSEESSESEEGREGGRGARGMMGGLGLEGDWYVCVRRPRLS